MARLTDSARLSARIVGPFVMAAGAAAVLRRDDLPVLVAGFRDQPSLTFAVGLLVLLAGVALLALHHHRWRSPAEIALSLIAWLFTLRGALLLLAPDVILDLADRMLVSTPLIVGAGLAAVALGVWLSLVGYRQAAG